MIRLFTCDANGSQDYHDPLRQALHVLAFAQVRLSEVRSVSLRFGLWRWLLQVQVLHLCYSLRDSPVCPEAIHEIFDRVDLRPAARRYSKILQMGALLSINFELWQTGICGCDRLLSIVLS